MKSYRYLAILLVAFLAMTNLTACDDEQVGKWPPMEWEPDVKDEPMTVDAAGYTYRFTCKNYGYFRINDIADGDIRYRPTDAGHAQGDWYSVTAEGATLTVSISPNDTGMQRRLAIGIESGDTFCSFGFVQNER